MLFQKLSVLLICVVGFGTSAYAFNCEGVKFLEGMKKFSSPSDYFPMTLSLEQAATAKNGTIDLSDGDQYSIFQFRRTALNNLIDGKIDAVEGTYEDGFDWTNGYNLRAKFSVKCTR